MTTSEDPRTTVAQLRALADLGVPPESIEAFRSLAHLGGSFAEVNDLLDRQERLIADAASNLDVLGQRGWGLASLPVAEQTRARALLEADQPDHADALLADLWDDDRRTGRVVARASTLGAADPAFRELSLHRRRLLAKARHHHHAGAYEASVPIVLAQVEGITVDATDNRVFFSKRPNRAANLEDLTQFVSITAGLPTVRQAYIADVSTTQARGGLSRHGILHGRELAYDTKVISAKVWSLLADVVEWAMPLAGDIAQQRVQERRAARAGSDSVNGRGQRLDDREFHPTRETLRSVSAVQLAQHRNTGSFRGDVINGWRPSGRDFTRHGLPADHGIESRVSGDGQLWWAWRTTVSGWVLGYGLRVEDGSTYEYMYAGPVAPESAPTDGQTWGAGWDTPPDWTSLDED